MSDIKSNRAAEIKKMYADEAAQDLPREPVTSASGITQEPPKKSSKGIKIFLTLILLVVLVAALLFIISKTTNWNILGLPKAEVAGPGQPVVKTSDWQAVFLSNGQVYFGKLKNVNDPYPALEDIYYLQVQQVPIQPAQPASTEQGGVQPAQQNQQQLILVKFGTELHRPMDRMYLNKDHILFFEDMSQESAVVKAIVNYKQGQEKK